jgi:probable F420-dependent oxidoreductase
VKPFRFGVSVRSAASRAEWSRKAKKAEDLGYSTFLVADHLAEIFPPLAGLVAAAEATTTLRVGTLVVNNDFRHPVLLARETATVDLLTDGRLELGIGAGHMESEYDEAGMTFDSGGTRIDRLAESVAIVKALWSGEEVTFHGRHYTVTGHRIYPRPVQRPGPPLLIGGNGKQLLTLAARKADIVGLSGIAHRKGGREVDLQSFTEKAAEERIAWVRQEAGERLGELELNALVQDVVITDDRDDAIRRLMPKLPGLTADEIGSTPYLAVGTIDEIVDQLLARRERLGISYYAVFEESIDKLAPIVGRLSGT